MMLEVSRRTGRRTICHNASHSTQVTTAAMVSEMVRKFREMRHSEFDERRFVERDRNRRMAALRRRDDADNRVGRGE